MKRLITMLSLVAFIGSMFTSCYNDEELWNSVNSLETRMTTLETQCAEMNTNISSLQAFVAAMEKGGYITNVAALTEDGIEVGYKVTFNDGKVADIYHNDYGKKALQVGVKDDADGKKYWTVEGEWVLDKDGNKVPVNESVTPKMKVENEKWHMSFDGGASWTEVADAVPGGSAYFDDVTLTDDALTLAFADGSVIEIPVGEPLSIVFGEYDASKIQYGTSVEIPYTVKGAEGEVAVFIFDVYGDFDADIVKTDELTGKIVISQWDYEYEEFDGTVIVFAVDGSGATVSKFIELTSGVLVASNRHFEDEFTYNVPASEGKLEIKVATNREFKVVTDSDWVTYAETKAVEEKTVVLDVKKNDGERRKAKVKIMSGDICLDFEVSQAAADADNLFKVNIKYNDQGQPLDQTHIGFPMIDLSVLENAEGQTLAEVLGYASWGDLAVAIGDVATVKAFSGDVVVTGYDLYTGESFGYIEYMNDPIGYKVDLEGYIFDDYDYCFSWSVPTSAEYLGNLLWIVPNFSNNSLNVLGKSISFGVHFAAAGGETARVEVTLEVTEEFKYEDTEEGKYTTPAAPGRHEFKVATEVDLANLDVVNSEFEVRDENVSEIIKSTLGMSACEIQNAIDADEFEWYYVLEDGRYDWESSMNIGANGWYRDYDYMRNGTAVQVAWYYNRDPKNMYMSVVLPSFVADVEFDETTGRPVEKYEFVQSVLDAAEAGAVITYDYVIRYKDYELVFTHEIKFVKPAAEE